MKRFKTPLAIFALAFLLNACKKDTSKDTLNWSYSGSWGSGGSGPGQFDLMTGLAVDNQGNQYISDINENRVQAFNSSGSFLVTWGTPGSGNGQFDWPRDIVTNTDGSVEVIDQDNHRIQKFTPSGAYLSKFGTGGTADGQFGNIFRMDQDSNGNLYVIDPDNYRIQKFNAARAHQLSWNYNYSLGYPYAIACSSTGDVYVGFDNSLSVRKETIVAYNSSGSVIRSWVINYADSVSTYISDMDFDSQDNLHVGGSDASIKIYKNDGTFIKEWGKKGTNPGEILSLSFLAFGPNDDLYVAGCETNKSCRVSKFKRDN